jgi:hypothetical protein
MLIKRTPLVRFERFENEFPIVELPNLQEKIEFYVAEFLVLSTGLKGARC